MDIQLIKSNQRLTKSLVRQMPRGYNVLTKPCVALGYVVNIIKDESHTAIFQCGDEYYTIPMDFVLLKNRTSCCRFVQGKKVEFKFGSHSDWWEKYTKLVETAFKTHIYIC